MKTILSAIILFTITTAFATSCFAQKKRTAAGSTAKVKAANMLGMLQGRWSSLEDKKTFFQVQGNRQIDIYGKDILDTATINFYDECPNRVTAEDEERVNGKYLIVQLKPNDFYCYSIDKISSQQLVLTYLPKGSVLRYKKVPTVKLEDYNTPGED